MSYIFQGAARHPRGVAAALFALLLPVFIGFAALSVDLGVIALARAQLKTAADAAALAGAQQLADDNRLKPGYVPTAEMAAAVRQAKTIGQSNLVLNATTVIKDSDVVIGELDWNSATNQWVVPASPQSFMYNSVQVTAQRSSDHGGVVPAFFSKLMGFQGSPVSIQSTATAQNYDVKGFKSVANFSANLLPIVLDQVTYKDMLKGAGTTTDQYTFTPGNYTYPLANAASNGVTSEPDGVYESVLYPVGSGSPGNWGTINVGVSNNSTSTLGAQIRNGITPTQLATFPNSTIQLDTSLTPPSITFSGDPGISAGIKDDLKSIIGKPVLIPIYDTNGGNGNNAWYRVVDFVGARILSVNFQGNPKYVIIQPALVNDPTAIPDRNKPLPWTSGGLIRLHLTR